MSKTKCAFVAMLAAVQCFHCVGVRARDPEQEYYQRSFRIATAARYFDEVQSAQTGAQKLQAYQALDRLFNCRTVALGGGGNAYLTK